LGTLPKNLLPEDIQVVRSLFPYIEIMRSIPIEDDTAVQIAQQFVKVSDYLLLDSHIKHDTQIGATGMTHDWNISQRIVASVAIPVVLAGGLGPENVAQAIERVRPSGVDSKTQTDKPGTHHKDPERVKNFVHRAKSR
jgi:phosphoribosylanthranilate isomerase